MHAHAVKINTVRSQVVNFVAYFQNDVISCAQQVELLENQFAMRMEQLQGTVHSRTAVPTAQVYVCMLSVLVFNR